MQTNLLFTPTPLSVCLSLFCITLTLTLKSYKVAGLFGLPSDDAYAVLQTQYALNAERWTEKYKVHLTVSLNTFNLLPTYYISMTVKLSLPL